MKEKIFEIKAPVSSTNQFILSDKAIEFLIAMERFTRKRRQEILNARLRRQRDLDLDCNLDFLKETAEIRLKNWKLNNTPQDLQKRRVEITGPVDRKMIINALNSGADVFMADFEDSNSPIWSNCLDGQVNLYDAVRKTISYTDPHSQKKYQLNEKVAVLIVRPRGWHLNESHLLVDGEAISASIFDAMLYLFHNAKALVDQNSGPYFYLPKIESHSEARLWNDVFVKAQELLNIPPKTIKATVLIETITAAFEMHEIIYALQDHIVGLNCGRWDYIFSFIKKFRNHANYLLPDRQRITMSSHFLKSYVTLLIATCHKRGIHAMGGMAAQIPIKNNEQMNMHALQQVFEDKTREAKAGHDGTWVAHPGLIPIALDAFDKNMSGLNQLSIIPAEAENIQAADLLTIPQGDITELGIRSNITVALIYLESWLSGNGCVPINNLMEDAATAEICRAQLWQWLKFSAPISNGLSLTRELLQQWINEEYEKLPETKILITAKNILEKMIFNKEFDDFLTIPAYSYLLSPKE